MLNQPKIRTIFFLLSFWIIGVVLAFWFGIGWFFLSETLRRIIIAIPQIFIPVLRVVIGNEQADEEYRLLSQKNIQFFYIWRVVVALIWLILTIVVFSIANIRLISLFQ